MANEATCATCSYFIPGNPKDVKRLAFDGTVFGECHWRPVAGAPVAGILFVRFPLTRPDAWCGQHRKE